MAKVRSVKVNGYSNKGRLARKERLRAEAESRNSAWAALTPAHQLAELNRHNVFATRQRARITAAISVVE